MAVVAKHGIWDNATYPWTDQTSAGIMGSIRAEIDGWITAISTNASIVANGMTPVKKRDETSSTNSGVRNGFVYEFPDTSIGLNKDGPTYPTLSYVGTETSMATLVSDSFIDNTVVDGYGTFDSSRAVSHYTYYTIYGTAAFNNQAIIVYDTVDGQEFFSFSIKMGGSVNYTAGMTVMRDQNGHWMFDNEGVVFGYDEILGYWTSTDGPYDTDPKAPTNSTVFSPYIATIGDGYGALSRPGYGSEVQGLWVPSNDKIYIGLGASARFGQYKVMAGGVEQMLGTYYNGPAFRIPV